MGQPVVYQWFHDSVPVSGATSPSLVLTSVGAADAGEYWVVASNALAAAYSKVAILSAPAQRRFGLDRILAHYGHSSPAYRPEALAKTLVLRLAIEPMTAKRRA
ncbi:MAG TPA: immunoglobulin domain-containing protein [Candidatus Sulfotelmatobacter sp.]|nr:immunoglobulin domain-containing protein [Candidatus Sulfotelmatobacter sp.]